jgi:hypothetical protein
MSLPVAAEEELFAALADAERAASDFPVLVGVESDTTSFSLVVGDPSGSCLGYFPPEAAETGLGFHSVVDPNWRDEDVSVPALGFTYVGHHSEVPRGWVVPLDKAHAALREFFRTGGAMPTVVDWEAD